MMSVQESASWYSGGTSSKDGQLPKRTFPLPVKAGVTSRQPMNNGSTLHIFKKKRRYVERKRFYPFLPHPDKIFIGRVQLGHSRKFQRFGVSPYLMNHAGAAGTGTVSATCTTSVCRYFPLNQYIFICLTIYQLSGFVSLRL